MAAPFVGCELDEAGEGGLGVGEVADSEGRLADAVPGGRKAGEVAGERLELGEGGGVVGLFLEGDGGVKAREGFVRGDADDVEEGLSGFGPKAVGTEGKGECGAARRVAGRVGDEGGQSLEMVTELWVEGFRVRWGDDGKEGRASGEMKGEGGGR